MKDETKALKKEMRADIEKMYGHNNSKWNKRTPEQRDQSAKARREFYSAKWTAKKKSATTKAQKEYCDNVLNRINVIE